MDTIWKLLKRTKPYTFLVVLTFISIIIVAACNLASPLLIRKLIATFNDGSLPDERFKTVNLIALGVIALYVLRGVINGFSHYIIHHVAYRTLADIRVAVYEHLQKLSLQFFQKRQTGELMSRLTNDINIIEQFISHVLTQIVLNVLTIAGVFVIMYHFNPTLALISLIPVPIIIYLINDFSRKVGAIYRKVREKLADISAMLQNNISGMGVIQAFTQEEHEMDRFTKESNSHYNIVMKAIRILSYRSPLIEVIGSSGTILVIWFGGYQVLHGKMQVEDLVAYLFYISFFYNPIMQINNFVDVIQQTQSGLERIFNILETDPDVRDRKNAIVPRQLAHNIRFENVFYEYEKGVPILNGISFEAADGQIVALVGPSGAGKSTITKFIPRFIDPTSGSVSIGGHDVRDLKLRYLRSQISMVLQEVFLFYGTIRENILYGNTDASEKELLAASAAALAHKFILGLPKGYDTVVGERGLRLSGGEKQRISIARAILKNAPILILDEATSSVDTQTENLIKQALENLMKDRTTLVIAHRLSTIQHADNILVIEKGAVRESGSHDQLLALGGLYSNLQKIQHAPENQAGA